MPTKKIQKKTIELENLKLAKQRLEIDNKNQAEFISKLTEMSNKLDKIEGNTQTVDPKKIGRLKKILIFLVILCILYGVLIIYGKRLETISTFPAIAIKSQNLTNLNDYDLNFEEINIEDKYGNNINGLYVGNGSEKTVFYFHGNGGSLDYFYSEIKYISDLGYNVMAYDYPGYGKSDGFPYKKQVDEFSKTFYSYMKASKNIDDSNLIVWGYSVGSAVATDFAAKNIFDKLILISPFSSRYDMSIQTLGFPLQKLLLFSDSYITKDLVKDFSNDVLVIHGNSDNVIDFKWGETVFNNYGENNIIMGKTVNKNFIELDNFEHNYIIDTYGDSLSNIFKKFISGKDLNFTNNYLLLDINTKEKLETENLIDLETDSSIYKFVTSTKSFNDKSYIPENLESISSEYVFDSKGGSQMLRKEANDALQKMAEEFTHSFEGRMVVVSAYRSYSYQKGIKDGGCPDNLCAKAGYSEHQSGLAVDLWDASSNQAWMSNPRLTNYFNWLNENAYKYGFHNTYQKGLEIDGYEIEPWHWRYLGVELATYLRENNLTIAEYYKKLN